MHVLAMPRAHRAYASAGCRPAYPSIVAVHGDILHSIGHDDRLARDDALVLKAQRRATDALGPKLTN